MVARRVAGIILMVVGGAVVALAVLEDTIYSFTPEGRFGTITIPGIVYQLSYLAGAGLVAAGYWLGGFRK
jgi:hypothetical protein